MIDDKRKEELETLLQWAICANDKYYYNMSDDLFGVAVKGNLPEPYIHQRKIGFEEFRAEMSEKLAVIHCAEEIHYMIIHYNYDDNPWVIEQLIINPDCDITSAKIAYWRCQPDYYYNNFGSPSNCPIEKMSNGWANVLIEIEKKATSIGFKNSLTSINELDTEQPRGLDFSSEPYCYLPPILR